MGNPDGSRDDLRARIAGLERRMEGLRKELDQVRREIDGEVDEPADAPTPPAAMLSLSDGPVRPDPTRTSPRAETKPRADLEVLLGRYGMLALAAILVLAAAGLFLSWAAAKGWLGPSVRVGLGLVGAAALAFWGIRVRRRHRPFGDSLLGIALATAHVCAWAAGPSLRLVPAPVALAFSAVASVGLAAFALLERDEPLWCIGFGGAALAPFVTSTGKGTAPMLAGYAAAVLVAGGSALGARSWRIGGRIFGAAAALFTFALAAMPEAQHGPWFALALPFTAAAAAALPFAQGDALRPRLRTLGLLGAFAAVRCVPASDLPRLMASIGLAAAGLAWLALLDRAETDPPGLLLDGIGSAPSEVCDWVDGALLPGAYLAVLLVSIDWNPDVAGAAAGLAAAVLLACAARRAESPLRDALAAVSWAAAVVSTLHRAARLPGGRSGGGRLDLGPRGSDRKGSPQYHLAVGPVRLSCRGHGVDPRAADRPAGVPVRPVRDAGVGGSRRHRDRLDGRDPLVGHGAGAPGGPGVRLLLVPPGARLRPGPLRVEAALGDLLRCVQRRRGRMGPRSRPGAPPADRTSARAGCLGARHPRRVPTRLERGPHRRLLGGERVPAGDRLVVRHPAAHGAGPGPTPPR